MRSKHGHLFIEFSLTLFVLLIMCLFPLLNLLGTATAAASLTLLAHETVNAAAVQQDFNGSLSAAVKTADSFLNSNLGRFLKLQPAGGYKKSGVDLYLTITNFHTGKTETIGPNLPPQEQPDVLENVYEYTVQCIYKVGPFVTMESVPILSEVPGLGKPATLSFSACRAIEHLQKFKLTSSQSAKSISFAGITNGSSPPVGTTDPIGGDWNYPNIYQLIAVSGQVVVANDVLIVDAINEKWTVSTAFAGSGENVWVDSRSDGIWSNGSIPYVGLSADGAGMGDLNDGLPSSGLEARAGDAGVAYFAGKFKLNFTPQGSGFVQFRFNDQPGQYGNNLGRQIVRVIVTRPG